MKTREDLCRFLVHNGIRTIRDGADHSEKANRRLGDGGKCVGYYSILLDYDPKTDTFGVGWNRRVPAATVDEVRLRDLLSKAIKIIEPAVSNPP